MSCQETAQWSRVALSRDARDVAVTAALPPPAAAAAASLQSRGGSGSER